MRIQSIKITGSRKKGILKCLSVFAGIFGSLLMICEFVEKYNHTLFQAALFFTGWVAWTFFEYMSHRYLMHGSKKEKPVVDFNHMHHHSHPGEINISFKVRCLLLAGSIVLVFLAVSFKSYFTMVAGFLCGFPGYTLMHYLLHQEKAQKVFTRLVKYHMYHHCKYPDKCYGISVTWWDDLLGTVPVNPPPITSRVIHFYFTKKTVI